MKTLVAIFAALMLALPTFGQSPKIEDVILNWGGPGALHKTTKLRIDLIENITAVKDEKGNLLPLYKMRVRLHNDESVKEESYRFVFALIKDTTHAVVQALRYNAAILSGDFLMEVYVPNEVNIEEVLTDDYMAMMSIKGEDTKENKKAFKKEVSVLMDKYYLCAMRFMVYKLDKHNDNIQNTTPSAMQDNDEP